MPTQEEVSTHYTHGNLATAIRAGVEKSGKSITALSLDDLAPVDEFHVGGREASAHFLDQFRLTPDSRVLDIGCGIGGPARFTANRYRCHVDGIDLTREYAETGQLLCGWVGLADRVHLQQGSALSLPFKEATFDAAYMLHVGMNIADKTKLCAEAARVLRPGGVFGIYDIMKTGEGELTFPVPWASTPSGSSVVPPAEYRAALQAAGFNVTAELNRRDFAVTFFQQLSAKTMAAGGPPPLGLHILMGPTAPEKIRNMVQNIASGLIAPVEMIGRKA